MYLKTKCVFYVPIAKLTSVNGSSYYISWPQNSLVYSVYPRVMSNLFRLIVVVKNETPYYKYLNKNFSPMPEVCLIEV